jgi:Flavin containing amine oxidoreductase
MKTTGVPMPKDLSPSVTIVGGGIAGLTAALRLAQRGCKVTIIEKESQLGGNLGGTPNDNTIYEVYPHMFGHWYENFWELIKDVGLTRERDFERRPVCGFLEKGKFPNYKLLDDNGSVKTSLQNLLSGILPVPDMFLAAYAIIDLLTEDFSGDDFASMQTLNGFLVTRPYSTETVAKFYQILVMNIWSVDSSLTSVEAFQSFAKYQFRKPSPQCWVLKDNSYDQLIVPLRNKLLELGCTIMTSTTVDGVTVKEGKVVMISYSHPTSSDDSQDSKTESKLEDVENLILAVTPNAVARLVKSEASVAAQSELMFSSIKIEEGPIVRSVPQLANTRRLSSEPIPVLYVTFKKKLPNIPHYYVALVDSTYSLTFVKIESLTEKYETTVLAIAASNFDSLPVKLENSLDEEVFERLTKALDKAKKEATYLILKQFNEYVPFKLGYCWGDLESEIEWDDKKTFFYSDHKKTFLTSNTNHRIFINKVGSRQAQPKPTYPEIQNLYFAGDTCINPIVIATVESAVYSGLQAAQALWKNLQKQDTASSDYHPIEIKEPEVYPPSLLFALKIMLAPYAVLAKCWADADDCSKVLPEPASAASLLAQCVVTASNGYVQCWKFMESVYRQMEH